MVMFISPTKHPKLWNAEAKTHGLKCSCLVKGDMQALCDTSWGLKPEFSLSLHLAGKRGRKLLLRKSWIRSCSRSPSPYIFGSWMVETWFPSQPFVLARARDEGNFLDNTGSDVLDFEDEDEFGSEDIACAIKKSADSFGPYSKRYQPVEEPWLLESLVLPQQVRQSDALSCLAGEDKISDDLNVDVIEPKFFIKSTHDSDTTISSLNNKNFKPRISERYYPAEEPWLFQSSLLDIEISKDVESVENEIENLEPQNQHPQITEILSLDVNETENQQPCNELEEVPEQLFLDDESRVSLQEESVATVILINSSLCTMQRIAVMEDGKLVEILLEPVKNNVHSDSVYIGVITKLVPHMGGAFVNIGCSRPSLMDIRHNRLPFIFPPFRRSRKQKNVNGSLVNELLEEPRANEDEQKSEQVEIIDNIEEHDVIDDPVQNLHDDFVEHDMDDEFDVSEDFPAEINTDIDGSSMEINGERNLHQPIGNSHISQTQTMTNLTIDMKSRKVSRTDEGKWAQVQKGTKIIVQVVKEGLGTKGPTLTAYPKLRSRFWVLMTRCNTIGISKKISGVERTRLRVIAKTLQPPGFGLTVRTVAAGHSLEDLQKDLDSLLLTWKNISEQAKSAALAADEGVEGAIPVMLHRAMAQTLSVVQDYFNDKVKRMVVDSPRTYHEVTNYLQEIAPDLCDRVELYTKKNPLFDEYNIEEELNNMLSKRVPLSNGGYLVIEQTEALVSIDVNGGQCMLGHGTSQEKAILDVNLAAAKQIARELRLRDIGGIIVVDFIDMLDDSNKRLVYEEVKKAVERDRSMVKVSELSRHGLMEITRKRVRPSVTFMISEPCSCCHATGRVEALETSFSKIEHEICRLLAFIERPDPGNPKSWPKFILKVDRYMCNYLTSGKRTRLAILSSSLKVWILLKVARGFSRGSFELKPLAEGKDHRDEDKVAMPLLRSAEVNDSPRRKVTIFPIKKWKTGGK